MAGFGVELLCNGTGNVGNDIGSNDGAGNDDDNGDAGNNDGGNAGFVVGIEFSDLCEFGSDSLSVSLSLSLLR